MVYEADGKKYSSEPMVASLTTDGIESANFNKTTTESIILLMVVRFRSYRRVLTSSSLLMVLHVRWLSSKQVDK